MSGSMIAPKTRGMKLGGNVNPRSFVKLLTTGEEDDVVVQCGAGDEVYGVCQSGGTTGQYKEIDVPGGGSEVKAAGAITRGDWVKPDANGYAVAASSGDVAGARAEASAVADDAVPVFVHPRKV